MVANYGQLKTALASLLNRDDLTSNIPDFITMLEQTVNREVKFRNRRMETTASIAISNGNELTLPTDYIETRALVFLSSPRVKLDYMIPASFENTYTTDTPATPLNYTITGNIIKIGPRPSSANNFSLTYMQKLPALTNDGDTNWLLDNHLDCYLYGSAIHSAPFLGDDSRLQTWVGLYDRCTAEVAGDESRARWNGAPVVPKLSVSVV